MDAPLVHGQNLPDLPSGQIAREAPRAPEQDGFPRPLNRAQSRNAARVPCRNGAVRLLRYRAVEGAIPYFVGSSTIIRTRATLGLALGYRGSDSRIVHHIAGHGDLQAPPLGGSCFGLVA